MWIPKWQRDRDKGVDSPVPTQVVSNEEFIPRRQTKQQQFESLIGVLAEQKAKRLGLDRRSFLSSSMGMATAFLAMNQVYGNHWSVDEAETLDPAASVEKWPKGEYFIFDVQTHFTNGAALGFRNAEFMRNMGFKLKSDGDAYAFPNMVKEMFFDSETWERSHLCSRLNLPPLSAGLRPRRKNAIRRPGGAITSVGHCQSLLPGMSVYSAIA